jgi:hypothetical protein
MLRLLAAIALISTAASLHACWAAAPLKPFVDRAKYVVHLKVVGIEEPTKVESRDGDELTYGPEYAVCEVKEILLGMLASDEWGRVRLSCVSRKNTRHVSGEVRYEIGDEVTIIADSCVLDRAKGMIFSGGNHLTRRPADKPSQELRDLIYDRAEAAKTLAEKLEKFLPGSAAQVEKALAEFEDQSREDFKDLSPEADLLLDLVAMARYTPDVADMPRPEPKLNAKHTRLALQALCDLSPEGAEIAAELVEGRGNGAYALLRPATVGAEALRKLADRAEFTALANHLLRYDFEDRALKAICALAMDAGPTAELAQWALIEAVEGGWVEHDQACKSLAPARSAGLPYDAAGERAAAAALDKRATRLAAWLVMRQGGKLTSTDKGTEVTATHTKQVADLYGQIEMLQVYAYALAVQGAEADHVKAARTAIAAKRSDKLDLTDVSEIEWELRKKNAVPDALRSVVRNSKTQRR